MRATPLLTRQLPTSLHTDTFHSMHGSLCRVKPPQRLSDRTGATRPMHACICVQDVPCMHKHDLRDVALPCQQTISAPPQNCRVVKHAQNSTMMYVHWRRNAAPALLPWPSDRGACCQLLCSSQLSSQALGLSTALNLWEALRNCSRPCKDPGTSVPPVLALWLAVMGHVVKPQTNSPDAKPQQKRVHQESQGLAW
jgi:hypothetical protein